MQCDRAQEFFSDYLERTLDRPMTVALEAHLAGCAGCREDIEALQATFYALDSVPEVEPPRDGAWQVMAQIRKVRAEQWEAERRQAPGFLEWLRSLNPLSAAMGASLATLVIGGSLMATGLVPHMQFGVGVFGGPRPAAGKIVATVAQPLTVNVEYGALTPSGQEVTLHVTPAADMPDAQVRVRAGMINSGWPVGLRAGVPQPVAVPLPPNGEGAEAIRLSVQSGGRQFNYLVVAPLGAPSQGPVNVSVYDQPLEIALKRLAPSLGRPVVAEGVTEGNVTVQVNEGTPLRALQDVAGQVRATVQPDGRVFRLVPQP